MKESPLLKKIQVKLSKLGARFFRNNIGLAWTGKVFKVRQETHVHVSSGDVVIRNARPIKFGLPVGSGDLIGWTPLKITQDMVGKDVAIFSSVEIKTKNTAVSKEQKNFKAQVEKAGGIAIIAYNEDDAMRGLQWKRGME